MMDPLRSPWTQFLKRQANPTASFSDNDPVTIDDARPDPQVEHRFIASGPALVDRSEREILIVRGADRAAWLHNLTTNHVRNVAPGEGNYAFALNLQGRILFDLALLVRREEILLDLDRRFLDLARRHFEKYTISEEVSLETLPAPTARMALLGPRVRDLLIASGLPQAANLALWSHAEATLAGAPVTMFRSDFHGDFAMELIVPADRAVELAVGLTDPAGALPARLVSGEAVNVRRIEAGIPWPGHEITDEYLPAETGQSQRAVSFNKGCYLGQEVVERMRSRGVVARRLYGWCIEGDDLPPTPTAIVDDAGQPIGTGTSACHSPAWHGVIGLGYVRTAAFAVNRPVSVRAGQEPAGALRVARLVELPFRA